MKRNKTDAADACALLEAARCADIAPVRVKSVEQQALQGLHRTRSLWMATRTSRINALRGFCRAPSQRAAGRDGRGRLELQSNAGDVQIVWSKQAVTVYDAPLKRVTVPVLVVHHQELEGELNAWKHSQRFLS